MRLTLLFAELREMVDQGLLVYPYSTRSVFFIFFNNIGKMNNVNGNMFVKIILLIHFN